MPREQVVAPSFEVVQQDPVAGRRLGCNGLQEPLIDPQRVLAQGHERMMRASARRIQSARER